MKILGAAIYLLGFLVMFYVTAETNFAIDTFGGITLTLLWLLLTMGIGTALMKSGSNSNDEK